MNEPTTEAKGLASKAKGVPTEAKGLATEAKGVPTEANEPTFAAIGPSAEAKGVPTDANEPAFVAIVPSSEAIVPSPTRQITSELCNPLLPSWYTSHAVLRTTAV